MIYHWHISILHHSFKIDDYKINSDIVVSNDKAIEVIKTYPINCVKFLPYKEYIILNTNDIVPANKIINKIPDGLIGYSEIGISQPNSELLKLIYNLDSDLLNHPLKLWIIECTYMAKYLFDKNIMAIILGQK